MNSLTPEMINETKDNKIKDLVGKNEKLISALNVSSDLTMSLANKIKELEKENISLIEENNNLKDTIEENEGIKEILKSNKHQIEALKENENVVMTKFSTLEMENQKLKDYIELVCNSNDKLKEENKKYEETLHLKDEDIYKLNNIIQQSDEDCEDAINQMVRLIGDSNEKCSKLIGEYKNENNVLKDTLKKEREIAQENYNKYEELLNEKEVVIENLMKEKLTNSNLVRFYVPIDSYEKLKIELAKCYSEKSTISKEKDYLIEELERYILSIKELEDKYKSAFNGKMKESKKYASLYEANKKLENAYNALKSAYDELNIEACSMLKEKNNEIKSLKEHNKFLSDTFLEQMMLISQLKTITKLSIR